MDGFVEESLADNTSGTLIAKRHVWQLVADTKSEAFSIPRTANDAVISSEVMLPSFSLEAYELLTVSKEYAALAAYSTNC